MTDHIDRSPPAESAPPEAVLRYSCENGPEQTLALSPHDPPVVIGRSPDATVALVTDAQASRLHAVIEWIGTQWTISDNGMSTNGTFVNGTRLTGRKRLDPGDRIFVGNSTLTFYVSRHHEPSDAASSEGLPTLGRRPGGTDPDPSATVGGLRPVQALQGQPEVRQSSVESADSGPTRHRRRDRQTAPAGSVRDLRPRRPAAESEARNAGATSARRWAYRAVAAKPLVRHP